MGYKPKYQGSQLLLCLLIGLVAASGLHWRMNLATLFYMAYSDESIDEEMAQTALLLRFTARSWPFQHLGATFERRPQRAIFPETRIWLKHGSLFVSQCRPWCDQ